MTTAIALVANDAQATPTPITTHKGRAVWASTKQVAADVAHGFFIVSHSGFALVGLALAFGALTLVARPDLRQSSESQLMSWLKDRQSETTTQAELAQQTAAIAAANADKTKDPAVQTVAAVPTAAVEAEPDAIERATAIDPKDLPRQQAAIAYWLSKKYRVAPEPVSALVEEAYAIGKKSKLEPTLILAVMAIESGYNPFAQSHVGAQGLMQVMTNIHKQKYEGFGGNLAAFDPVSNMRVGAKVLEDCIRKAGSVEGGLKHYVGAALMSTDGGYGSKVLAEQARLQAVAQGRDVPTDTHAPAKTASASKDAGLKLDAKLATATAVTGFSVVPGLSNFKVDPKSLNSKTAKPTSQVSKLTAPRLDPQIQSAVADLKAELKAAQKSELGKHSPNKAAITPNKSEHNAPVELSANTATGRRVQMQLDAPAEKKSSLARSIHKNPPSDDEERQESDPQPAPKITRMVKAPPAKAAQPQWKMPASSATEQASSPSASDKEVASMPTPNAN